MIELELSGLALAGAPARVFVEEAVVIRSGLILVCSLSGLTTMREIDATDCKFRPSGLPFSLIMGGGFVGPPTRGASGLLFLRILSSFGPSGLLPSSLLFYGWVTGLRPLLITIFFGWPSSSGLRPLLRRLSFLTWFSSSGLSPLLRRLDF